MGNSFTFKQEERLKQAKLINSIFNKEGQTIHCGPVLLVYLKAELESKSPVQVMFSVSKKKFKNAVDRNLIKRRMREAYRLTKHQVYEALLGTTDQYALALLYLHAEKLDYQQIEEYVNQALEQLIERIK